MTEVKTYRRDERDAWVPTDNADSLAEKMVSFSDRVWCGVQAWTIWETSTFQMAGGDRAVVDVGEHDRTRLRLELDTSRRRFHTIREQGTTPVTGGLILDLYAITAPDEEIGGRVTHWGPDSNEPERNDIVGTVMVRDVMMKRIVRALRASENVTVGIGFKAYKPAMARSFDEDWMLQDFYVDWQSAVPVDFFGITITDEQQVVDLDPVSNVTESKLPAVQIGRVTDAEMRPTANLSKRADLIVGLLILIVLLLLFR